MSVGMSCSNLEPIPTNKLLYRMNMTWTPTFDQMGGHLACFTPVNTIRLFFDIFSMNFSI